MTSTGGIAGGDIQLNVNREQATAELEQLRATVRGTFSSMSDDALKFASAQDRYDRALKASNGRVTASVRSAELNLRRVQSEATRSSAAVVRGSTEASAALAREERAFGRLGRGALAGSGLMRGLGRSVAFASSTFLGGAGLLFAIRSTTDAATAQQAAEGQLETALKNRGEAVGQVRRQVGELVDANAKLGFGERDTTQALTLGVTATGSLAGATRILTVAQNVARARGTDLYTATKLLVRGFEGQSRSLKALGIDVAAGTKGYALLDQVQSKYSGRAVAFANSEAGARARLRAELERTKVTIGNELLPVEARLASRVADYLGKASNQAKIQREVNHALSDGGHVLHDLGLAYRAAAGPIRLVNRLTGGTEHSIKFLAATIVAAKFGLLPSLFRAIGLSIRGAGAAAVVSAGEMNTLAAAEARAAAAGGAAGGAFGLAATAGLALGGRGLILPGVFSDSRSGVKLHDGQILTQNGHRFVVHTDANGNVTEIVPVELEATKNATAGDSLNPRANVPGSPSYVPPSTSTGTTKPPPLDRLSRIDLAIADAQTAVARGEPGAQRKLITALKDQIAYDLQYETTQRRLIKTDAKNAKTHAAILGRLLAEEQSARDQIASIEEGNATKAKATADKAAAARTKAARDARRRHTGALATEEARIEARITTAQTGERDAKTEAQLLAQQRREQKARRLLVAFYEREAHDVKLTAQQRAAAVKNAARARQELAKSTTDNRAADLKQAVLVAQEAVANAVEGTAAYDKAIAAEKRALSREIAYYAARAHNKKISLAAQRASLAEELALQKQRAALDKKTKTAGSRGENERQFLESFREIVKAYAPNAFPVPVAAGAGGSGGKSETYLYEMRTESRIQSGHLRTLAGRGVFPATDYSRTAADAVVG